MTGSSNRPSELLRRRLASTRSLSEPDGAALDELPWIVSDVAPNTETVREGDKPDRSFLLLEGIMAGWNYASSGERKIHAVYVPGDMPDLMSLQLRRMDHFVGPITKSRVAFVSHTAVRNIVETSRPIMNALWRESLIEAAVYRATIVRTAKLRAIERLAHLLCELRCRIEPLGLVHDSSFQLPLSQELIGEILGLTSVSVNRAMQALRNQGLISLERADVTILDEKRLREIADFDPAYLHLESE